jgi:hypothetical protein
LNKISEEAFLSKKTSDIIYVLGSGYSINKVKKHEWDVISQHDSIAFNWFCKHWFEPTFYLIREQANISSRKHSDETTDIFISSINKYKKTCCIICDVTKHTQQAYKYHADGRIKRDCIVMRDDNRRRHGVKVNKYMERNPLQYGLVHGTCTLYNVMHVLKYLNYKKIAFVGVDLYNSRYFWLRKSDTRHTVRKKHKTWRSVHAVSSEVIDLVRKFKKFPIELYITNKRSSLNRVIPYLSICKVAQSSNTEQALT